MAPSARASFFASVAGSVDAITNIVFLLIQRELRQLATNPAYISSRSRPENIRIHPVLSHVRFYPLRFNSSGNFCDGGAICSRRTPWTRTVSLGFRRDKQVRARRGLM